MELFDNFTVILAQVGTSGSAGKLIGGTDIGGSASWFSKIPALAWMSGIAALLASTWQWVRLIAVKLRRMVVAEAAINSKLVSPFLQVAANGSKLRVPNAMRSFDMMEFQDPETNVTSAVAYELLGNGLNVLWYKGKPLIWISANRDGDGVKFNTSVSTLGGECVMLYGIRGFANIDELIREVEEGAQQLLTRHIQIPHYHSGRYCIHRMAGRSGISTYSQGRNTGDPGPAGDSTVSLRAKNNIGVEQLMMIESGIMRLVSFDVERLRSVNTKGPQVLEVYAYPPEIVVLFEELGEWLKMGKWYRDRQIPYRLGLLMPGRPGTGKTTLVRNLARYHRLPIYAFDLSTYSNSEFLEAWQIVKRDAPSIALLEDIDTVYHKRDNVVDIGMNGSKLTFDCLLNALAGVDQCDGVITIITTNRPELLDPALAEYVERTGTYIVRPGRIDRVVELHDLTDLQKSQIAQHVLRDWPDLVTEALRDRGTGGSTAAQFQERCVTLAIHRLASQRLERDKMMRQQALGTT